MGRHRRRRAARRSGRRSVPRSRHSNTLRRSGRSRQARRSPWNGCALFLLKRARRSASDRAAAHGSRQPPVQPHPEGAAAGGILATALGSGKRLAILVRTVERARWPRSGRSAASSRIIASMPARTPIILDCDPGHDDALAITLALARPELELLAITTVAGNAPLDGHDPQRPARPDPARADRTSRSRPARGAPLVRPAHAAVNVHGDERPRRRRPARAGSRSGPSTPSS